MRLNLNEKHNIEGASWIEPGKVLWKVTCTARGGIACVDSAVTHQLKLDFLDKGNKYSVTVYSDDPVLETITLVRMEKREVNSDSLIERELSGQSKLAVIFKSQIDRPEGS